MVWENIKLAFKDMAASKLRTLLSLLGIVIGVASVIAILTLGESATKSITQSIVEGGLEMVTIFPNRTQKAASEFSEDFGDRLMANVKDIRTVLPVNSNSASLRSGQLTATASINGVLSSYAEVLDFETAEGTFFSMADNLASRQVVALGSDVAEDLFPDGNAVGQYVSIQRNQSKSYLVVAVMEAKDASFNLSFNTSVFIPYNTYAQRFMKPANVGSYVVRIADGADPLAVSDDIQAYLDSFVGSDAYNLFSPASLAEMAEQITGTFSTFLSAIAAISLLVGGIGIMNIMLASVTERTREIGIRRALGARRRDIILQFLVETVLLSGAGGILGVLLGVAIPFIVTWTAGMKTIITLWSPLLAFSISAMVGVVFGIYPAMRAAQMDPVEALRHE